MDEKAPTFRNKMFADYQIQRPPMANELSSQIGKAKDVMEAFKIPIFSKPGFEADDVIGTIASEAKVEEVVIVTGDRDILQLVNDKIKIYMPILGLSNSKLFGVPETVQRLGITPKLIPDYKALVGDPSDNYPGVPGIGPKTAINLITKYKSLGNIYKNLSDIPPATREKLEKGKDSALMSLKLATIVKDVPIKFDLDKASGWKLDSPKVLNLFAEYGFKTLTERVKKVGKEIDDSKQMILL
jgi:DNA polymerase-1